MPSGRLSCGGGNVALIAASALISCLGDGERTFAGLLRDECGLTPLRHKLPGPVNVAFGGHVPEPVRYAGELLTECVGRALTGLELDGLRMVTIVGTGLRELAAVERDDLPDPELLHFGDRLPGAGEVITLANACSAGGHALALAQDLIECGEADVVVAAAADLMTTSMLAMIGRVVDTPTERVRPFDRDRRGVLLGEGAGAVVVTGDAWRGPRLARLLATGLSCDAYHETAPDVDGICRAVDDAFDRCGRRPKEVDLVLAHGTGTALNDPAECEALRRGLLARGGAPRITAVKGALGHMSGTAALANVDVALRCLATGWVPPVVGLREPLDEAGGLRFVTGEPVRCTPRLVQVNAFGFGGVNSVTLLEAAP